MEYKKILFIGLGGAGQRHLRIFKELLPEDTEFIGYRRTNKTPLLNKDFSVNSKSTLKEQYNIILYNSFSEALKQDPDLIVISNPTSLHYDAAKAAAEMGTAIFIEKPFSHNLEGFEHIEDLVLKNNLNFFISFQRRFHPYLKKVKEIVANGTIGKVINSVFNVCTFVPQWHPYEDFHDLYACKHELGGGVLLTEIHELDLCYWYFVLPEYVYCTGGNYSNIKMDVEDTAHVSLKYKDFSVQVNLCFMQNYNRRCLFIAGTDGYIEWNQDGNKLLICSYTSGEKKEFTNPEFSNDDMFFPQATYFLYQFQNIESKKYLEIGKASLAIVEAAKESMTKGTLTKLGI